MLDPLADEKAFALEVIKRLESAEPLSLILPAARRLADTWGQRDVAYWLYMEEVGGQSVELKYPDMNEDQRGGFWRFMRTRGTINVERAAKSLRADRMPTKFEERDHLSMNSIAQLERSERPKPLTPPVYDDGLLKGWAMAELAYSENLRVLARVKTEVHRFAVALHGLIADNATKITIFGPDVFTVFQVAGPMLAELDTAPETLRREGAYLAAQQARTTILRMNKDLYQGPKEHTSPIDGKTYDTSRAALSRLRAFLDDLWVKTDDPARKQLVLTAMDEVEEAYQLGSKAKDATQITYAEALRAIQLTFNVAKTIMLCGGFPIPTRPEELEVAEATRA